MIDLSTDRFEELVREALDEIPPELGEVMDNVVVVVEDDPPQPGLLGLYQGVPITARGNWYAGVLPDRISVYRNTICAISNSPEDVEEQVRVTVVHEIAHHFGIDDAELHELGWA